MVCRAFHYSWNSDVITLASGVASFQQLYHGTITVPHAVGGELSPSISSKGPFSSNHQLLCCWVGASECRLVLPSLLVGWAFVNNTQFRSAEGVMFFLSMFTFSFSSCSHQSHVIIQGIVKLGMDCLSDGFCKVMKTDNPEYTQQFLPLKLYLGVWLKFHSIFPLISWHTKLWALPPLGFPVESPHHNIKGGHWAIQRVKFIQNCINGGSRS